MVVDASAIISMLAREPDAHELADVLGKAVRRLAPTSAIWESVVGLTLQYAMAVSTARQNVSDFVQVAGIEVSAIGEIELEFALDAYEIFGKGRHPARLNMGDCFVYALAKTKGAALLHKDNGFWLTDLKQARTRA